MGLLQTLLDKKDEVLNVVKPSRPGGKRKKGKGGTPDEILTNEAEVERLSQYIADDEKKKIINTPTGVKHGVDQIGTKGDTNGVLKNLLEGATVAAKKFAAKILVKKWAKDNLKETIVSKSGKELIGKAISKNIYIKEVTYQRAGKMISYVQARSRLTGRVISYKTALKLIGKM